MGSAASSVGHLMRREWVFRGVEDEILIVRGIDLRPEEEAEGPHLALLSLDRWLGESSQTSVLAEMCQSTVGTGGAFVGTVRDLKSRLEDAFNNRSLVVVRAACRGRGVAAATPEVHRIQAAAGARSTPLDLAESGLRKGAGRGWELAGRTAAALVAKKGDLRPGEPIEDPLLPISYLPQWVADPSHRGALADMYKAVYGRGDAAHSSPVILRHKLEEAFRSKDLVMLRVTRGGGGGGGGPAKKDEKKAAKEEKEAVKAPPKKIEKTWVRFRLLDEDGEPMDDEPYEMVDSNGTQRKGKLNKDGTIYIPPILTPGDCTITFPEIHLNPLKNPKRKRTRKLS